jgi:hypothetical protein
LVDGGARRLDEINVDAIVADYNRAFPGRPQIRSHNVNITNALELLATGGRA